MNFGERMAQLRKSTEQRLRDAIKRKYPVRVFTECEVDGQLLGAVKAIEAKYGRRAELHYNHQTKKVELLEVQYEEA